VLLLLSFLLAVSLHAQRAVPADWEILYATGFDGGRADGWSTFNDTPGRLPWTVEKDEGDFVFSGAMQNARNPATYSPGAWSDFRLKARIKVIEGSIRIGYRYSSCSSYFLRLDGGTSDISRQVDCGSAQRVAAGATGIRTGRWYALEVVGATGNLRVWLDGILIHDYTDRDPIVAGGISFEAGNNSHVHIDDIEVRGPRNVYSLAWVRTGGPLGGVGYDIRMHPANPDLLYVTDVFSGVHISRDGGQTWAPSNQGIVSRSGNSGDATPIFCLTIDQNNPDIVWAGTQNARGIYRSADGGKTWVQKDKGVVEGNGITFRGFTVDPRDSNVVYAAGEISSTVWAGRSIMSFPFDHTMGVVYKTTDGGENWKAIWRGDNLARYVWLNPKSPDTVYVSTGFWDRMAANTDDGRNFAGGVGILKSTDGGNTWRVLNQKNGLLGLYVGSLFMHPQDPDVLLAGAGNNRYPADSGVYLSTDGGETWTKPLAMSQNITAVEFASSNPDIAYACSGGEFYRSVDGGRKWTLVAGGSLSGGVGWGPPGARVGVPSDIQVDPRDPDRLFVNSYVGGNFLTEDGGRTWVNASRGYTGASLSDVAVDPSDHRRVYAIGRSGPYRSDDGGVNWQGLFSRPTNVNDWFNNNWGVSEWSSVAINPADPTHVLVSDEMRGSIIHSARYGLDWRIAYYHFKGEVWDSSIQGFKGLTFAPSDPSVAYAGMCADCRQKPEPADPSFGIYRSADGGESWKPANDALTANLSIHRLTVDPRSSDIVYAGTAGKGVLRTMDGGQSWRTLNDGLRTLDVRALAIDPVEWWTLYAATNNGGLYKSTDAGATWQLASAGISPNAQILDIVIDPVKPNVVYAADQRMGVFRSEDRGKFWVQIDRGLTTRAVRALALSSDGGTLYAATDGGGIFRLDLKPFDR